MSDLAVANEIRRQLGRETLFMLGAEKLLGDERSLQFRIKGSDRVNSITITLAPNDTYTVRFCKIGKAPYFNITNDQTHEDIYVDALHDLIQRQTGLDVRMPRIKGINC